MTEEHSLRRLLSFIVPDPCYERFFVRFDLLHGPCLKILLSKCLGLGIIAGSVMVKVPQIVKIVKARSAVGISFNAIISELVAIAGTIAYSVVNKFPFSAWGEAFFLLMQTLIIGFFTQHYGGKTAKGMIFVVLYLAVLQLLLSPITPLGVITFLQALNMPAVISSKLLQAGTIYRTGHTGELSAITMILVFAGSLARIFTSLQETGDGLLVLTFVVASSCNGILVLQLLYYWNVHPAVKKKK
uniref:Solute carrier family 66 member 3 n=1 Tax=Eptatretus burgeri TaxID=7764 RepID=A0A8C4QD28_EPTBU